MRQARLQDACESIVDDVDGALGCALVDLVTGLPLALDVRPGSILRSSAMELISAAGVAYFRDNLAIRARTATNGDDSPLAGDEVQEIQATTADTYNFMSLVPGDDQELLILIADRNLSNLGLGWMAMRQALDLVVKANENEDSESPRPEAPDSPPPYDPVPRAPQPTTQQVATRARKRRTIWGER